MEDQSENEKKLFDAINDNRIDEAKRLLLEDDVKVDSVDKYGSTALQQAAFKGNLEMCQMLVAHGANVNNNRHQHGYTALMFAALSGNADLCRFLLESGARPDAKNRLGKSTSEMAAFTGQHHCVSVVNNFLPIDEVERCNKTAAGESRVPGQLLKPLHLFTRLFNVHPVRILLLLADQPDLSKHLKSVMQLLEDVVDGQMKKSETNEVMAVKVHMILTVFKAYAKFQKELTKPVDDEKTCILAYVKSLLRADQNGFQMEVERLLRQAVKEFPYQQSTLFHTIIRTLGNVPIGSTPTALHVINQVLLGHVRQADVDFCETCGDNPAVKRCSACKVTYYCSESCQKLHWFTHKIWCKQLANEGKKSRSAVVEEAKPDVTHSDFNFGEGESVEDMLKKV